MIRIQFHSIHVPCGGGLWWWDFKGHRWVSDKAFIWNCECRRGVGGVVVFRDCWLFSPTFTQWIRRVYTRLTWRSISSAREVMRDVCTPSIQQVGSNTILCCQAPHLVVSGLWAADSGLLITAASVQFLCRWMRRGPVGWGEGERVGWILAVYKQPLLGSRVAMQKAIKMRLSSICSRADILSLPQPPPTAISAANQIAKTPVLIRLTLYLKRASLLNEYVIMCHEWLTRSFA